MTSQPDNARLTPLELLARQNEAVTALTATVELLQHELKSLRTRVEVLEGVPLPGQEPPEPS